MPLRLASRPFVRCFSGAGAGYGNVQDKVLPSASRANRVHPTTCDIIGAPMTYGQPYCGTDSGPTLLRQGGLLPLLTALEWRVKDMGDLDFDTVTPSGVGEGPGKARNLAQVSRGVQQLADAVADSRAQGRFPLVLGGDHSIGLGTLAGLLRAKPDTGVLWVDAHADLHTPLTSESGNMHGMPVGLMMEGVAPKSYPGLEWLDDVPKLQPDALVYVGLRDVDAAERQAIADLGIRAYTMHDIDRYGIGRVMDQALEHLSGRPLHLSYDIDAVDPVLAPATGTTVRGGLTYREAHFVAEACYGHLESLEIVELNPTLSHAQGAQETVDLGLQLITSAMGKSII